MGSEDIQVNEDLNPLVVEGGMGSNEEVVGANVRPFVALDLIEDMAHEVGIVGVGIGGPLDGSVVKAAVLVMMEVVELGMDEEFEGRVIPKGPKHPADVVSIKLIQVQGNGEGARHVSAKGVLEDGVGGRCKGIGELAGCWVREYGIGKVLVVVIGIM